jgi:spermidine/putrescine-binding protein
MTLIKKLFCLFLVLALSLSFFACGGSQKVTLNVLNWGDYIDPDLLKQFEEETGISVKYTTMTSNEEMLVKLSSPDNIYDICFPSDYLIEKLISDDLLYAIDTEKIPNLSNIDPLFLDLSFEPGNTYSVPYMWGTVGILYSTTMVDDPVDSWTILWNEKYSGKILMYDSMRDTSALSSRCWGTTSTPAAKRRARRAGSAHLAKSRSCARTSPTISRWSSSMATPRLGVVYSGDAVACIAKIRTSPMPCRRRAATSWFDNMIIPAHAAHKTEAEAFNQFPLRRGVAAQNSDYIGHSTPNAAALALMGPDYTDDPTYNPPQDVLEPLPVFPDLGDFVSVFSDAWTKIKAA